MSETKKIHAAMAAIKSALKPVGKEGNNVKQGYKFRKVEDVYGACQPVMAAHGVHMTAEILSEKDEERKSGSGTTLIYRKLTVRWFFWCAEDGSSVAHDTVGEGMDSGDKASNKAMTASQKYALIQAFCIPTEEANTPGENLVVNSEDDSHEVKSSPVPVKKSLTANTIFDGSTEHQTALAEKLKSKQVPEPLWDDINTQMNGKPLKDWLVVAELVRQEFIAKQIPF